jgi:synaptobrevin family protein YKT6
MKIIMTTIFRHRGPDVVPIQLASASNLGGFSFFTRGTVGEHLKFASRTVCQRTAENQRQSVAMKDNPFVCCSFVRPDGLAAVTITDQEYPERVAYSYLNKQLIDFE